MMGNGVKRKHDDDEAGWEAWQVSCRPQTVLNMSLMKLYEPRTSPHLTLQRRVLINNIIRRIHGDLRRDGGVGALLFSAAPPAAPDHGGESYRPYAPPASLSSFSSSRSALDSCPTPDSLLEEDLPMFFTLPTSSSTPRLLPSPKEGVSSRLEEMCPPSSRTLPPLHARLPLDVVVKEEDRDSFLVDFSLDDAHIDAPPRGAHPSKTAPGVMNDLVRSGSSAAGAQNQLFKTDLAELDHIMEVLGAAARRL